MGGIAALIRFDGAPVDPAHAQAISAAMAYRGPDGCGWWTKGGAAIGQFALHATAPEEEEDAQPIASDDGEVVLAFDGFLANFSELQADLLARGVRLHSSLDAELALRAYEVWGPQCAARLEGEFAIVLWDGRLQQALCLRDHHGLRPLYWHWDGRLLVAASEIAAVLAASPSAPAPNWGYLAEIAADEFYSARETVWQGIERLAPAHTLTVNVAGPRQSEYWVLPTEVDIFYRREEEYAEHYREVLGQSVRRAARSHRPVACEVSGGLDSSAVFGLAHHLLVQGQLPTPGLRGYTLAGPPGTAADEASFARLVAAHTGTAIAECPLFLPPLDWFGMRSAEDRDLPPLPNAAMSIHLEQAAMGDGCRVLLGGLGGDQWCDGTLFYYAELFAARDWRRLIACYAADLQAEGVLAASDALLRLGLGSAVPPAWRRGLRRLAGRDQPGTSPDWLRPRFQHELAERRARYRASFGDDYRGSYKLRKLRHPIWSLVLDQASRQRAHSGIEMRSPMMSRAFIEFSARTPEWLKLRGGTGKHLHRRALAGILPSAILQRQSKAEFSICYAGHIEALHAQSKRPQGMLGKEVLVAARHAALIETHLKQSIDERHYGEIWGSYVVNLISSLFRDSAEKDRPDVSQPAPFGC